MDVINARVTLVTVVTVILVYVLQTMYRMFQHRRRFRNCPGPPHNWLFGHLISVGKVAVKIPTRVHSHCLMYYLQEEYNLPQVFYVDVEPINAAMLIILDPELANQITTIDPLTKSELLAPIMEPLAGSQNLLVVEGALWKKWRSIFNPGFSSAQLMSQVPIIVECVEQFANLLETHAHKDEVFRLEEDATRLTLDVIGRAVLDHDFKCLTTENEFMVLLRKQLSWFPHFQSLNPFHRNHPVRPWAQKYYKRRMENYIGKVLDERFSSRNTASAPSQRKKFGIDLALDTYYRESGKDFNSEAPVMDPEFRRFAIDNLLVLIFAGHDTTASTICYIYHLLAKHPEKLAKLRKELDEVFGTEISAADQLTKSPYLINKLEYTQATIREVLRLWAPASTIRQGRPGYFIREPETGEMLDTDKLLVWVPSMAIHRSKKLWGEDSFAFRPERFLPENVQDLPPDAFRPFEKGPRNCIGQELAMLEMKLTLALTAREFDVRASYAELDKLKKDGMWAAQTERSGPQEVFGDEMYQILVAAGKPRDGMPARVVRRKV